MFFRVFEAIFEHNVVECFDIVEPEPIAPIELIRTYSWETEDQRWGASERAHSDCCNFSNCVAKASFVRNADLTAV